MSGQGTGFVFDEFNAKAFGEAIARAIKTFRNAKRWKQIVRAAMSRDWSWGRSAAEYVDLYRRVVSMPPAQRREIGFPKAGLRP
jgi:starch synthase